MSAFRLGPTAAASSGAEPSWLTSPKRRARELAHSWSVSQPRPPCCAHRTARPRQSQTAASAFPRPHPVLGLLPQSRRSAALPAAPPLPATPATRAPTAEERRARLRAHSRRAAELCGQEGAVPRPHLRRARRDSVSWSLPSIGLSGTSLEAFFTNDTAQRRWGLGAVELEEPKCPQRPL